MFKGSTGLGKVFIFSICMCFKKAIFPYRQTFYYKHHLFNHSQNLFNKYLDSNRPSTVLQANVFGEQNKHGSSFKNLNSSLMLDGQWIHLLFFRFKIAKHLWIFKFCFEFFILSPLHLTYCWGCRLLFPNSHFQCILRLDDNCRFSLRVAVYCQNFFLVNFCEIV